MSVYQLSKSQVLSALLCHAALLRLVRMHHALDLRRQNDDDNVVVMMRIGVSNFAISSISKSNNSRFGLRIL